MLFDNQKLVAPERFSEFFEVFFIVFNHANAWASMCLLVEIHNRHPLLTSKIG